MNTGTLELWLGLATIAGMTVHVARVRMCLVRLPSLVIN